MVFEFTWNELFALLLAVAAAFCVLGLLVGFSEGIRKGAHEYQVEICRQRRREQLRKQKFQEERLLMSTPDDIASGRWKYKVIDGGKADEKRQR